MARYSLTVQYNDANVGFLIQDAIAKILAEQETGEIPTATPTVAPPEDHSAGSAAYQTPPAPALPQQQGVPVRTVAPIPQPVHQQPPPPTQFPGSYNQQTRPATGSAPQIRDPNAPATEAQLGFLQRLAHEAGIAEPVLFHQINQLLQTPPDGQVVELQQLFKGEASKVIEALKNGQIIADTTPF